VPGSSAAHRRGYHGRKRLGLISFSVAIPRHPEQAGTKLVTGGGLPNNVHENGRSARFYC
jgi:hypothetical protein